MTLKSIRFVSDHGVMKDNRDSWSSAGTVFPEPEWRSANADSKSAPISHTKAENIRIEARLDVSPESASSVPFVFRGQGPYSFLEFETVGSMNGGKNIVLASTSKAPTPDEINAYLHQVIVWSVTIANQTQLLGISADHDIFVTVAPPPRPGEVTYRRMHKAVEITAPLKTQEPHAIVKGIMAHWNRYNLKTPLSATGWEWIDNFKEGAQCIDIVRFVQGVINMIGSEGLAEAVVVYADPKSGNQPIEELWEQGGCRTALPSGGWSASKGGCALHKFPGVALLDGDWKANAYEAALKFNHGGKLAYYPGGVQKVANTPLEVLHAFRCLATIVGLDATMCRIDKVHANYPAGPCIEGTVKQCWYEK